MAKQASGRSKNATQDDCCGHTRSRSRAGLPYTREHECGSRPVALKAPARRQQQGSGRCRQLLACRASGVPTGHTCLAMMLARLLRLLWRSPGRPVGPPARGRAACFRTHPGCGWGGTGPQQTGPRRRSRHGQEVFAPADRAERAERRRQDRKRLQLAAEQLLTSDGWKRWVRVRSQAGLARLSISDQLLVALARPDATFVAGFNTWLRLGHAVRKGERGGDHRPSARQGTRPDDGRGDRETMMLSKTVFVFDTLSRDRPGRSFERRGLQSAAAARAWPPRCSHPSLGAWVGGTGPRRPGPTSRSGRHARRCRSCLVATATVLELPPMASSQTATSCLCTGCDASGRSGASVRRP